MRNAADAGNIQAQIILASMYLSGIGVAKDEKEAAKELSGNNSFNYGLGLMR